MQSIRAHKPISSNNFFFLHEQNTAHILDKLSVVAQTKKREEYLNKDHNFKMQSVYENFIKKLAM